MKVASEIGRYQHWCRENNRTFLMQENPACCGNTLRISNQSTELFLGEIEEEPTGTEISSGTTLFPLSVDTHRDQENNFPVSVALSIHPENDFYCIGFGR